MGVRSNYPHSAVGVGGPLLLSLPCPPPNSRWRECVHLFYSIFDLIDRAHWEWRSGCRQAFAGNSRVSTHDWRESSWPERPCPGLSVPVGREVAPVSLIKGETTSGGKSPQGFRDERCLGLPSHPITPEETRLIRSDSFTHPTCDPSSLPPGRWPGLCSRAPCHGGWWRGPPEGS